MEHSSSNSAEEYGEQLNVLDIAIVLAKHKKLLLYLPLLAALLALIIALLLPKVYTATARILPPQKESSAAAMLGMLAGTPGSASSTVSQALGLRNPNDLYGAILKGQTVADRVIEPFKLKELYEARSMVS